EASNDDKSSAEADKPEATDPVVIIVTSDAIKDELLKEADGEQIKVIEADPEHDKQADNQDQDHDHDLDHDKQSDNEAIAQAINDLTKLDAAESNKNQN